MWNHRRAVLIRMFGNMKRACEVNSCYSRELDFVSFLSFILLLLLLLTASGYVPGGSGNTIHNTVQYIIIQYTTNTK